MPKCLAPHAASHCGKPIDVAEDGSCELTEEALADLRPHGFREWNQPPPVAPKSSADPNELSRPELIAALKGKGYGNLFIMKTDELRALAARVLFEPDAREPALAKSMRRATLGRRPASAIPDRHGRR